jgi:hypothetical protein
LASAGVLVLKQQHHHDNNTERNRNRMAIATIEMDVDKAFKTLTSLLRSKGPDVQKRIMAHVRAVSGKATLPNYHGDETISAADKFNTYRECAAAILSGNYDTLQGEVAQGAKRVDPLDEVPPQSPAVPPVVPTLAPPPARAEKPAAVVAGPEADDLRAALIRAIAPHLMAQPAEAKLDEKRVGEIAAEMVGNAIQSFEDGFKERLEKALSNGSFPTERVKALIDELKPGISRIEMVTPDGNVRSAEGLMHPQVPQLLAWLMAGVPVWAWSAAGSGKTHLARQIAAMLGIEAYVMSVDPTLTVAKIMGYRNVANGEYVEGFAYRAFKFGGLLVADEKDTGDAGVMAAANAMLSNSHYLFPNGETVEKHKDFRYLALANTKGMGAVAGYTARNRLDAATLDRFAIVEVKYDKGLELALATGEGTPGAPWKPGKPANLATQQAYVAWVQKLRENFGSSVLLSPRASINGCKALRCGIPLAEVVEALVFKLVSDDSRRRMVDSCGLPQEVV